MGGVLLSPVAATVWFRHRLGHRRRFPLSAVGPVLARHTPLGGATGLVVGGGAGGPASVCAAWRPYEMANRARALWGWWPLGRLFLGEGGGALRVRLAH